MNKRKLFPNKRKVNYLSYVTVLPSTVEPSGQPSISVGDVRVIFVKLGFNINALVAKVVSVLGNFPKPSFVSELLLNASFPIVVSCEPSSKVRDEILFR